MHTLRAARLPINNYNSMEEIETVREGRLSRKQLSEVEWERAVRRESQLRFSEPKTRLNMIKINKNKLPVDFFPRKDLSSRRIPALRPLADPEPAYTPHRADSERLHYSPEKTSFFACFEDQYSQPALKVAPTAKFYSRKFETRDEPKRDAFPADPARKLTTATRPTKNELLELFPSTHDEQMTDIIISSSKTRNLKLSPRKEITSKYREPHLVVDPEKHALEPDPFRKGSGNTIRVNNVSMETPLGQEALNITFFNAKSTCFPPINPPRIA